VKCAKAFRAFLDIGHSGINDSSITRRVPNGRGGTKDCQTTGTSTDEGYPEHSFNWDVEVRVRGALEQLGVHTQMSRADDDSVAPCVDQRAAAANAMHPNADVSIHADGGPASGHGFHVNYSAPPLNDAQSGPSIQLATVMRDAMTSQRCQMPAPSAR
jgi:N-acetylmuramoyl-L-alanine amidase